MKENFRRRDIISLEEKALLKEELFGSQQFISIYFNLHILQFSLEKYPSSHL